MQSCSKFGLIFLLLAIGVLAADYTKVIPGLDPEAKCLDGSPAYLYVHEGGDTKNIMFYFVGGGLCVGYDINSALKSCYDRSRGKMGSSTHWPSKYNADDNGIVSTDPSKNKFANWTKIIFGYCDGSLHQGNNKKPIQYKDSQLYFRGSVNTRQHIKWADQKYNLSQAQRILVTGSSAGGMATYLWADYVRGIVPQNTHVYGVADSSIYYAAFIGQKSQTREIQSKMLTMLNGEDYKIEVPIDSPADYNPFEVMIKLANADERPPNKQCSDHKSHSDVWECLFIEWSYHYLKKPLLFIESSYDQLIIEGLGIKCLKKGKSGYTLKDCNDRELTAVEVYRDLYLQLFATRLVAKGHSMWSISCSWHAGMSFDEEYGSELQRVPKTTGLTIKDAVERFVFQNRQVEAVDIFSWPSNTPCAY